MVDVRRNVEEKRMRVSFATRLWLGENLTVLWPPVTIRVRQANSNLCVEASNEAMMAKKRKEFVGKRSKSKKSNPKPAGQPQRRMWETMGMHYSLLETDPGYRGRQMEIEGLCGTMMNQKMAMPKKPPAELRPPESSARKSISFPFPPMTR